MILQLRYRLVQPINAFKYQHYQHTHTHTYTRLTALFPGLPGWAGTRKVKPIWILLKQETVSGSGISWAICKSAPRSRQITMPATHHSVFYGPDALPATQPTVSMHWRHNQHYQPTKLFTSSKFYATSGILTLSWRLFVQAESGLWVKVSWARIC